MHSYMASSSNPHNPHNPFGFGGEEEDQMRARDWLDLGLGLGQGFGSASSASASASASASCTSKLKAVVAVHGSNSGTAYASSSSPSPQKPKLGLEIGVGLSKNDGLRKMLGSVQMPPSFPLFTSPPLPIDPTSFHNRFTPLPLAHTHHCSPRPQPGIWFTLRSSINRNGEELPQLPKAYIRVKDENVTVFVVKTYLVTKLGLSSETEIVICCMGKKLVDSLTLKQVRDAIWLPGLVEFVKSTTKTVQNSNDVCVNHLMSLHYGRQCLFI